MEKEKRAQTAGGEVWEKDVVRLKGGCAGAQVRRASLMELLTRIRAAASRWKTLGCHLEFFITTFFFFWYSLDSSHQEHKALFAAKLPLLMSPHSPPVCPISISLCSAYYPFAAVIFHMSHIGTLDGSPQCSAISVGPCSRTKITYFTYEKGPLGCKEGLMSMRGCF